MNKYNREIKEYFEGRTIMIDGEEWVIRNVEVSDDD